jgi:hypothetical protein
MLAGFIGKIWMITSDESIGLAHKLPRSLHTIWNHEGNVVRSLLRWLWHRPLLLILLAHTVFSIGIWNARDGYDEETVPVEGAFHILQFHHVGTSPYNNLVALTLRYITADAVLALTFVKYLCSLLATLALYLALSSFSGVLRRSAIIFACLVWIASSLNAPYAQSSSLSLFSFAIMLLGFDCLLLSKSLVGVVGFFFFGIVAALSRPEYYQPVVLVAVLLTGRAVWAATKALESRVGWSSFWTRGAVVCLALAGGMAFCLNPPGPVLKKVSYFNDDYALLGLGQCYADFYHGEHPGEALSPMTEYRSLLDRTFNRPASFSAAVGNNPLEALRYFTLNGGRNLFLYGPRALLGHSREQSPPYRHGFRWADWMVRILLLICAMVGMARLARAGWKCDISGCNATRRKLLLLGLLFSTSFVAMVLLVGTPRYYLCWVPLFYLGVAYCADSLLRAYNLFRYESLLVALSFIFLCAPNYLTPRPNYEFEAVRHVASLVRDHPTIAAGWAEPDAVIALRGKATAISLWDGIRQSDIQDGKIDILLIDQGFRKSKTWYDQRDFFEQFERQPETFGFKKAIDIPTGSIDVYYKVSR